MEHSNLHAHQPVVQPIQILPQDKAQALNALIKVTQNLLDMSDKEAQALAQNDMLAFAIIQDEKEYISERYTRLSAEFRGRVDEFRGTDKGLLDRLDNLQKLLGEKTRQNNVVVSALYQRSKAKTESTLLAAQEIGQQVHIRMPKTSNGEA